MPFTRYNIESLVETQVLSYIASHYVLVRVYFHFRAWEFMYDIKCGEWGPRLGTVPNEGWNSVFLDEFHIDSTQTRPSLPAERGPTVSWHARIYIKLNQTTYIMLILYAMLYIKVFVVLRYLHRRWQWVSLHVVPHVVLTTGGLYAINDTIMTVCLAVIIK